MRRAFPVTAIALLWLVAGAGPAAADPAGPTDFQTSIIEISPDVPGFEAEVIGGDSFLVLATDGSVPVDVVGYRGEPYLRFLTDGTVEQNDRSPTTYLNEDRYASVEVPPEATPDAEPLWRVVATDGSFAWHDHRAHWMNEVAPPGRGPGDTILEGVVPLLVDGVEVDLTVQSVWQDPPSPLPAVLGFVAGLALAAAAWLKFRRTGLAAGIAAVGAVALAVGMVDYFSVPSETAPSWTLWVPPLISLVLATAALLPRIASGWGPTLVLLAAVELVVWAVVRWDWMWRAIIPTAAPYWVDRAVTAAVVVACSGMTGALIRERLRRAAG